MIPSGALPILYSFRRCPYAMRARMALLVAGTPCTVREVALRAKPDGLRAASPKATVPVLVLPGGAVLDESLDIMRWALAHADPESWLDGDDPALLAANDGAFKHHLDRYKYPGRHASDPQVHHTEALRLLVPLESRLEAHAQLCGEQRSLADIALFPFVRQFSAVDPGHFAAAPFPRLHNWLAGQLDSALFARAMVRHAPWQPGDVPVRIDSD